MENVFVYLGILSPLWSISVSPVLAKRSSFTVDGPIPQMILLQSKQIWTMCRNICIRVKFTFQLSELSLPCCTFLSWNFANKPSTFLLISIILRRLVTMQFFASGAHNDGKSSGLELIKSDEISAVCDEMTNTNTVEKKSESNANLCV